MSDEYSLLSPFIQKYIYDHGWKELRDVQSRAIKVILKSDYHLLIAAGTASGKTEAAFFPILTALDRQPSSSIGALYISPLKALINDQFARLEDLLLDSEIPLWHWHGDVSSSEKQRALRKPSGIMQITPESLESLLMYHTPYIPKLFSDLRFVIIDEVHTFMGKERGSQVLCQLKRIEEIAQCHPRRVGLSATINDYQMAKAWLKSGTDREVSLAKSTSVKDKKLSVKYYDFTPGGDDEIYEELTKEEYAFYSDMYKSVRNTNSIVFANTRRNVEFVTGCLKKIAKEQGEDEGQFYTHHGSLSASLRGESEDALRDKYSKSVVVATATLELGIDIGDLDKIVQLGAPGSCSSYVQRLGRSGRRNNVSNMQFYCSEQRERRGQNQVQSIPEKLPWELLKILAIIELYEESKWIEPFSTPKKPFSLLYHQTMSVLHSSGGMKPGKLANFILSLPPFKDITKDEYRQLLKYLLKTDQIEKTSEGLLIIGLSAERRVNHYSFLAIFEEKQGFTVFWGDKEIGTLERLGSIHDLTMGGRFWKVTSVDLQRHIVKVQPAAEIGNLGKWSGDQLSIHSCIVKKMREILTSDEEYPYLNQAGHLRLNKARKLAKQYDLCNCLAFQENDAYYILPWVGSMELDTLYREIKCQLVPKYSLKFGRSGDLFLSVRGKITLDELIQELHSLRENHCDPQLLVSSSEEPLNGKYAQFVPKELRITEMLEDCLQQDFEYL